MKNVFKHNNCSFAAIWIQIASARGPFRHRHHRHHENNERPLRRRSVDGMPSDMSSSPGSETGNNNNGSFFYRIFFRFLLLIN